MSRTVRVRYEYSNAAGVEVQYGTLLVREPIWPDTVLDSRGVDS